VEVVEEKIGMMVFKRTHIAISIGVMAGIGTHFILSGKAASPGDVGDVFRSYWRNIFSLATFVFFASIVLNKRWSDKVMELDISYKEYSRDRDALVNNLAFDSFIPTKAALLCNYFVLWISLGVIGGCLFDGFVYLIAHGH
jgi:hypothetical protein